MTFLKLLQSIWLHEAEASGFINPNQYGGKCFFALIVTQVTRISDILFRNKTFL